MGHTTKFNGLKPAGIRTQNLGDGIGQPKSGNCTCCGVWHTELIKGYCADDYCKRARKLLAIAEGKGLITVGRDDDNINGYWSRDSDGVVRFKRSK